MILYAQLGNTPTLSLLELQSVCASASLVLPTLAKITTSQPAEFLGNLLGGTTKLIAPLQATSPETLLDDLVVCLANAPAKNVAVTALTAPGILTKSVLYSVKQRVTETRPVRFLSLELAGHSLVALRKQHVYELVVFADAGVLTIGQTIFIQNADDWTVRDREKPYRDIKRGMLPPKVARIMVNLACLGQPGHRFADPFCGTGTTLAEAAMVGCSYVVGSDTYEPAVLGAARNLDWLRRTYSNLNFTSATTQLDATHFAVPDGGVITAIATEPYMGPLLESINLPPLDKLKNITKGLSKLYLGSIRSWDKVLAPHSRIVISLPSLAIPINHSTSVRELPTLTVDDFTRLGYNSLASVAYGKPGATVVRNITILEKN